MFLDNFLLTLWKMAEAESKYIVEQLKRGDQDTLERIYRENRDGFVKFSRKYNVDEEEALDIFQDAIIVLRDNAVSGKIDAMKSNISTYLFAIGKYKIYQNFRLRSKTEVRDDIDLFQENLDLNVYFTDNGLTNEQKLLQKCFEQLGSRCKSVLNLFYNEGYNLDEIKEILNYSNKKVLKSQKSRCIRQLRDLVNKNYDKSWFDR